MAEVLAAGQAEQIARLRLIRSENVGPATFRQPGLPAATVQTVLLELEIAGRLVRHAGGRVALSH